MSSSRIPEVQSPKQRRLSVGANLRLAQPLGVSRRLGSVSHSSQHLTPHPLRRRFFCAESPPTEGTFPWLDPMSLFPCSGSGDSEASISLAVSSAAAAA